MTKYIHILLGLILFTVGCDNNFSIDSKAPSTQEKNLASNAIPKEETKKTVIKFEDIYSSKIKIGMTPDEIKKMFGTPNGEVNATIGMGQTVWCYDVEAVRDYRFEATRDQLDVVGLENGKIKAQIFVTFDKNQKVNVLYMGYIESLDGKNYTIFTKYLNEAPKELKTGEFQ